MERAVGQVEVRETAFVPLRSAQLPPYAEMLAAYHAAHAPELQAMIADLPIHQGAEVLDVACGGGAYTRWLAERLGPEGLVVGVDIDPDFLAVAADLVAAADVADRVSLRRADVYTLPFMDNSFDLAWCAQSMYTLPDPAAALQELRRVVRPGGTVAVFENDTVHQMVLPWPADLELAVRQAQLHSFIADDPLAERFFIGRDFGTFFRDAGFAGCRIKAYTTVRQAPLEPNERSYLSWYLQDVGERAGPLLESELRRRFEHLIDPAADAYLLDRPDFTVTYIDLLALGHKQS